MHGQASVPEKTWSAVEDGLVPGADKIVSTWMDAKSTVAKRAADFNICVARGRPSLPRVSCELCAIT